MDQIKDEFFRIDEIFNKTETLMQNLEAKQAA